MEKFWKLSIFIILIPTPDFPHFYYMLGGNLGSFFVRRCFRDEGPFLSGETVWFVAVTGITSLYPWRKVTKWLQNNTVLANIIYSQVDESEIKKIELIVYKSFANITKTCPCNFKKWKKMIIFRWFFFLNIFSYFAQNIDCGYSIEPPH